MKGAEGPRAIVHAVDIDWRTGSINDPVLKLLVEGLSPIAHASYERRPMPDDPRSAVYWTAFDGFASVFFSSGVMGDGLGGWRQEVRLVDGSIEEVVNCRLVSPDIPASAGFPPVMNVVVVEGTAKTGDGWKRHGGVAYYCIAVERAGRELSIHRPEVELIPARFGNSTVRRAR